MRKRSVRPGKGLPMIADFTKLSADEFLVRERSPDREYTGKLAGEVLQTKWYPIILTSALVRKLLAMKIGDTVAWGNVTSLDLTKLSANEFFGREYPNDEEVKCALTGELLEIGGSIFPLYLNPETVNKSAEMKVGDTVTLYPVEGSERFIDCPSVGVLCAVRRLKNGGSSKGRH